MRDHEGVEELIALGALDGLDPSGERELAAQRSDHGADCEECLRLESTYDEVAGRLAFAVEPAEIREGFEDQLVALARGGESPERGDDAPPSIARERERRRFARPMRLLAGVVAAALIVGAGVGGYLLAPKETTAQALGQFLQQHENARRVPLSGSANGVMNIFYAPGNPDVFVVGSGLDQPPSGKAYELWMFRGQTPVSAGCFAPEKGNVLHEVNADLSGANAMAVTVESNACPAAPTSQPVMSASI
jgi:Anti-sigma-K factor rskA